MDETLPSTITISIQIFAVMIGILVQVFIINWWIIFAVIIMFFLFGIIRRIYLPIAQTIKRLEGIGTLHFPSLDNLEPSFMSKINVHLNFQRRVLYSHM